MGGPGGVVQQPSVEVARRPSKLNQGLPVRTQEVRAVSRTFSLANQGEAPVPCSRVPVVQPAADRVGRLGRTEHLDVREDVQQRACRLPALRVEVEQPRFGRIVRLLEEEIGVAPELAEQVIPASPEPVVQGDGFDGSFDPRDGRMKGLVPFTEAGARLVPALLEPRRGERSFPVLGERLTDEQRQLVRRRPGLGGRASRRLFAEAEHRGEVIAACSQRGCVFLQEHQAGHIVLVRCIQFEMGVAG